MQPDESLLVYRAKNGDTRAFGELVMAHQGFVYNLALRAVGDPDEAQDAAQEALLRAWQALPTFRGDSQFRTWLYRIVINLCYNRRPRLRREAAEMSLEQDEDCFVAPEAGPERQAEAAERKALLQRAIDRLPSSYRLLVMLRYQQDMAYEDIAEVMNLPLGTVKTGLFRAKALLRQTLVQRDEVVEWAR
jgi:RNA polymerase sigma-70 factor (ECF subfamily)